MNPASRLSGRRCQPLRHFRNRRYFKPLCVGVAAVLLSALASLTWAQNAWTGIRQRGEIIISTDATYAPFEYKDKGRLTGFDIELGDAIGKQLGVKVTWLPLDWSGVQGSLTAQKADLIMSGMTITDKRKQEGYTFTRPYFLSGQALVRRVGDTRINTVHDLRDKNASVQGGTTGEEALKNAGLPSRQIIKMEMLQDGFLDVRNHRSDAAVADIPALKSILRMGYSDLELAGVGALPPEYVGLAAARGELELAARLNQALDTLMVDGTYARLYLKWIGEPVTTQIIGELDRVRGKGSAIPADIMARIANEGKKGTKEQASSPNDSSQSVSTLSIRWSLLREYAPLLLLGARYTLELTALTILFGVAGGLIAALLRLSPIAPLRAVIMAYVELVRGTPLLMQIYFIYFVLPALHVSLNPVLSGVVALSLNAAAYISEIFRAGIESIDVGQMEAARALGLDYRAAMRWIILPQTVRRVLPPLTNEAVALLKDSSLVSVVGVTELMREGKEIVTNTGAPTTIYLGVAALYLAMTLPLTWLVRRLERRWQPISKG